MLLEKQFVKASRRSRLSLRRQTRAWQTLNLVSGEGLSPSSLLFLLRRENPFSRLLGVGGEREKENRLRVFTTHSQNFPDFDPLLFAKRLGQLGFRVVTKEAILQAMN